LGCLPLSTRSIDSAACTPVGMPPWQVPCMSPYPWRIAAASPIAYTSGWDTDRNAASVRMRPCSSTASPAAAASGDTRVPLVHRTASAAMLSPPASSTASGSTFRTSTPGHTRTPSRSSAARRFALAPGFMAAPGSCLPSSTTFNSGRRSAISAADSTPVSPLPATTTVPLPSRASRSASSWASWALLRVYAWSSAPGTAKVSATLPNPYTNVS
jgi:hypothetical protein